MTPTPQVVINRAYRVRLYPTPAQDAELREWERQLRFLYNLAHEQRLLALARPRGEQPRVDYFRQSREITAKEVGELFGFQPRTAALLCQRWVESGFLEATDPARKSRRYRLNDVYEAMLDNEN